jgi:7-cyano-7-deazaguanine synthase in queuosine biosynthesis
MKLYPRNNKPTVLLLFDGGLTSTGALWKLLNDNMFSLFDIHLHHITLWNQEKILSHENLILDQILAEDGINLMNNERLIFTESLIEFPIINNFSPHSMDVIAFVTAQICNACPNVRYLANTITQDDWGPTSDYTLEIGRSHSVFNAACIRNVDQLYPVGDLTKQRVWDMLPPVVQKLTLSCRSPRGDKPCNMCKHCIQRLHLEK